MVGSHDSRRVFRSDIRGSVALLFAFSVFATVGAVGLAVDGARVYSAKQQLQSLADAAVLAAARRAMAGAGPEQIDATFAKIVNAYVPGRDFALTSGKPDLSVPRRISTELVAGVPTVLMPVLGFSTVEVRAFAVAEFGFTKLEIALALDTTGSMAGAKLTALKHSAERLVDTLLDKAPEDGDVRIALVPFSHYVNVGMHNRHAPWIDVPSDYSVNREWCRDEAPVLSTSNCRTESFTYYNDGVPMTGTRQVCDHTYGPPVYTCTPYTSTYTWSGCVGSRNYPLNVQDGSYSTRVPGVLNAQCPSPLQPLTSSRSTLRSAIDGMQAIGETYLPAGLMWGFRALSPGEPFTESAGERADSDGNRLSKVLILMTDGENTKSPTYPDHEGTNSPLADQLTIKSCSAIKAANIQLFTIAFDIDATATKELMRSCASSSAHFYDAANSGQLDAAMQAIGAQLGGLRLTN